MNTAPRTKKTPQFDLWSLTKKHHTYCCQVACTAPQAQWPDYCTHYQYQRPPNMPHKTFIWWMLTHWTRNSKVPKVARHCQALPSTATRSQHPPGGAAAATHHHQWPPTQCGWEGARGSAGKHASLAATKQSGDFGWPGGNSLLGPSHTPGQGERGAMGVALVSHHRLL